MKNRKMLLIVSLVLAMTMSLGGTLAYLTDTDGDVNVMTVGRVEIKQNEMNKDGSQFTQNQPLLPIVTPADKVGDDGYPVDPNYINKIVSVTNTGNTNAWVRTLIAIPDINYEGQVDNTSDSEVIHWNFGYDLSTSKRGTDVPGIDELPNDWYWGYNHKAYEEYAFDWVKGVKIGGKTYTVYIATHFTEVAPGKTTAPNLNGVYMDKRVDYDNDAGNYVWVKEDGTRVPITGIAADGIVTIPVLSQAVQASGFKTAYEAFAVAFDNGETQPTVAQLEDWFAEVVNVKPEEPEANEEGVYEIGTAAELFGFANMVNGGESFSGKTVKLTADIDLANQEWTPIGQTNGYYAETYFQGTFDGQGHTISNLSITETNEGGDYAAGFFGFIDAAGATIKNVKFDNATVEGHHWTAVVVGYMTGEVSGCHVSNSSVVCTHANNDACGDKAAIIVGCVNDNGNVITNNSATNCTVEAGRDAGQIIGAVHMAAQYENTVSGNTATTVVVSATEGCTGENITNDIIGRKVSE